MGLKQLRKEAGLSQRELGEQLSKATQSATSKPQYVQPRICAYENGRNGIPLGVALELVKILNRALRKKNSRVSATLEELAQKPKKKPR